MGLPERPGLQDPSSSYLKLPNYDLRSPLPRGRWKQGFLPLTVPPTPHGARGSPQSRASSKLREPHSRPRIFVLGQLRRSLVQQLSKPKQLGSRNRNPEIVFKVQMQFC